MAFNQRKSESQVYAIRVKGHLDQRWSTWFDGMTIALVSEPAAETIITGVVADQAALYGILARIRDLGLAVIAVNPVNESRAGETGDS